MKNVEKMSIKEAITEFSELLMDIRCNFNTERFNELYYKLKDNIKHYVKDFTTVIEFQKNPCHVISQLTTNVLTGFYFDFLGYYFENEEYCICRDAEGEILLNAQKSVDKKCAIYPLKKLREELTDEILQKIFKGQHDVSFKYLLVNPRKDVVKWALQHKEELGLNKVERNFVEKYQVIPELRELIFNTLEVKEK